MITIRVAYLFVELNKLAKKLNSHLPKPRFYKDIEVSSTASTLLPPLDAPAWAVIHEPSNNLDNNEELVATMYLLL